jgi:hypothetical protein
MGSNPKRWRVVCVRCLEEGDARWVVPGSPVVEVLLYVITAPIPCLAGFAYTGLRSLHAHWACDVCGSRELVPVATRRGRALLRDAADTSTAEL